MIATPRCGTCGHLVAFAPQTGQYFCGHCRTYLPSAPVIGGKDREGVMVTIVTPAREVLAMVIPENMIGHPLQLAVGRPDHVDARWRDPRDVNYRLVTYEGVQFRDRHDREYWVYFSTEDEDDANQSPGATQVVHR